MASPPKRRTTEMHNELKKRVEDLESLTSDNSAHIANLETRLVDMKSNLYHMLSKRTSDLESQACDLDAHVADLETRITNLKKRIKNSDKRNP
jgi:chaperonin cofactor prefoldin